MALLCHGEDHPEVALIDVSKNPSFFRSVINKYNVHLQGSWSVIEEHGEFQEFLITCIFTISFTLHVNDFMVFVVCRVTLV